MNLLASKTDKERRAFLPQRCALRLAFAALWLFTPIGLPVAEACVCDLNPPCAATWQADAVFVGTVVTQLPEPLGGSLSWIVRNVAVTQKLRGSVDASITLVPGERPTAEQIAQATSLGAVGWGGSSCEYGLQVGRQYVIYARRTADGRWTTSMCSGTKPIEEAAEDLDYFASLPTAEPAGRVYGKIEKTVLDSTDRATTRVVPATRVTVALTSDSNRLTVMTDAEGKLDVRVPPGEYTIAPVVPQTVRVFGSPIQRLVPARGCAPVYFSLIANGRIEGHVVQEDGTPVPRASVDVIPADLPPDQQPDSHTTAPEASTDEKGRFAVDAILPGRYVIAVNGRYGPRLHSPYATTYFPGPGRQDASVIEIGDGERKTGFTIVVKRLTETTVSGVVLFADDRPVADAFVTAAPADHARVSSSTKTDGSGLFQLRVLSGVTYVFKASARPGDGSRQTETVVFVDQQPERIRLSIRP
jgi:hypothetical protein